MARQKKSLKKQTKWAMEESVNGVTQSVKLYGAHEG